MIIVLYKLDLPDQDIYIIIKMNIKKNGYIYKKYHKKWVYKF